MRSVEKKKRRSTIGADPLAAIIPIGDPAPTPSDPAPTPSVAEAMMIAPKTVSAPSPMPPQPTPASIEDPADKAIKPTSTKTRSKKRTTLNMDSELDDAIRDAVFALSGPEVQMNLVRFVEEGLTAHLKKLQRKYNEGDPFPKRAGKLRTGRPLSS